MKIEFMEIIVYGILFLALFISLFAMFIEFLYKKYKQKNDGIKIYPFYFRVVFWIGITLALIPLLFIL